MARKEGKKKFNKKHIDHDPQSESAKATYSSEKQKSN
ncbi:MAG: CPC_1213 family protein [Clostridiaceae bacterium]